jgi:hypothetical protein
MPIQIAHLLSHIIYFTALLTHAMMIKMIHTLVAKFAMHTLFGHCRIADPTMLGRFRGVNGTVGSGKQSRIRGINIHGHNTIIG